MEYVKVLLDYMHLLKAIQDLGIGFTPYGFENKRVELHHKIIEYLCLEDNINNYEKTKYILSNLDKVCAIYSMCEEWKLKSNADCHDMANYLERFLWTSQTRMFIEGSVDKIFMK